MSVAAVVLAAGLGRRMTEGSGSSSSKLLHRLDGESLLRRCCRLACDSELAPVVVVLGHDATRLRAEVDDLEVEVVVNPHYASGQASSVRAGLAHLGRFDEVRGALFVPADQPGLDGATLRLLTDAFDSDASPIVAPRFGGRRGAPVLFSRDLFAELDELDGDEGGRQLLRRHHEAIRWVELDSDLPLLDADTPAALFEVGRRLGSEVTLEGAAP